MFFHSLVFGVFFSVVFCGHWLLPVGRGRTIWLLAASYVFYMSWNVSLAGLMFLVTVIHYYCGRYAYLTQQRRWCWLSIGSTLGVLAYFKYANLLQQTVLEISHRFGYEGEWTPLSVILPLGISFYTFQGISYSVDMIRREYKPYPSLGEFAFYISFFPQLIAGPIVRADYFSRQIQRRTSLSWPLVNQGCALFVIGVFKKVVIADQAAVFANAIFGSPAEYTSFLTIIGVLSFSFQIYFDFSAYTDMARGLGYLLGYQLPENFDHPYNSVGVREFWRRWHISLSTWLRDYLYIPLGGSRCGRFRAGTNLMATMLLGGLWHGAQWHFMIWGGIHGLWLAIENALTKKRDVRGANRMLNGALGLATFLLISFTWVFFRADSLSDAFSVFQAMMRIPESSFLHQAGLFKLQNWGIGFCLPLAVLLCTVYKPFDKSFASYPVLLSASFVTVMLVAISVVAGGANEFIYFQF